MPAYKRPMYPSESRYYTHEQITDKIDALEAAADRRIDLVHTLNDTILRDIIADQEAWRRALHYGAYSDATNNEQ